MLKQSEFKKYLSKAGDIIGQKLPFVISSLHFVPNMFVAPDNDKKAMSCSNNKAC